MGQCCAPATPAGSIDHLLDRQERVDDYRLPEGEVSAAAKRTSSELSKSQEDEDKDEEDEKEEEEEQEAGKAKVSAKSQLEETKAKNKQDTEDGHSKKIKEREAIMNKYPGNPYKNYEETRFAEILLKERLAVVKADYFEKRLAAGKPFQDRANIPPEDFISGVDVIEQWSDRGAKFPIIFSYAWLTAEHPDPDMYHLKRIVSILRRLKNFHDIEQIGVILDFCSLWQRGHGKNDKRTETQLQEFKEGLKEINTPYAHKEITAVKLTSVPKEVQRKYDDRGWTLFERIIVDGKASSDETYPGRVNVLTLDDDFDPDDETDYWTDPGNPEDKEKYLDRDKFIEKFCSSSRTPPCTPERFELMLNDRRDRAVSKGVSLFTSGSDQAFVIDKYKDAFAEMTQAEQFDFLELGWGDKEVECLSDALRYCGNLTTLQLEGNPITEIGAKRLAAVLPNMKNLEWLNLLNTKVPDDVIKQMQTAVKKTHPELYIQK